MRRIHFLTLLMAALAGSMFIQTPAAAQYFGRNKVQYDQFDFKVFETEHFIIHYYDESELKIKDVARMAERWYQRHSRTFLREFHEKKPLIFYANDADFHQTNAIFGSVGEGTGGVTEALKERVVMPLTGIYAETDHVLGHELVHSFQYDIGLSTSDSVRFALNVFPLWVIEGTAEYLSVGREDPHTAMWLRDAALRDDLPTAEDLTNQPYKYFPYRYGQAYMAYIGGKYGDTAVTNLYKLGGRTGLDSAFVYALGIQADSLSNEWIQSVKDTYLPLTEDRTPADSAGRPVLNDETTGGDMNVAPTISPDGRYVAFISERDLFNINLFIANAETGKVIQRLKGGATNEHFDSIRFINSAGAWSPDGKKFAYIAFAQGDNEIVILDIDSGKPERRISVESVGAMFNTAWSPDGRHLAFTGIDGGVSDLYILDLETTAVRQLTNDRYAALQPTWSPDGETIAFATDRGPNGTDFENLSYAKMRLGLINVESGEIEVIRPFEDALHHNPQFSPDGRSLYFISDQDGFKDIYRYALTSEETYRVTHLQTGASGITALSPAMSVAAQSGRMMFSVYTDNTYPVYSLEADEAQGTLMTPGGGTLAGVATDTTGTNGTNGGGLGAVGVGLGGTNTYATASILPPPRAREEGLVGSYLSDPSTGLPDNPDYDIKDYGARLRLDYVAPPSVGVSVGGPFGTGVSGGVGFFFSDMLGNHNLTVIAQANGTIKDLGGQVSYLNQKNRFNYGGAVGHIPILFGGYQRGLEEILDDDGNLVGYRQVLNQILQRIYIDQVDIIGSYPLTTTRRFDVSTGFVRYGVDYEVRSYYYDGFGYYRGDKQDLDDIEPDPLYFFTASAAYVGDYSSFGFTSPVSGGRYRFDVSPYVGSDNYVRLLLDWRRYQFVKPFTFALRALHIGNYSAQESDDPFSYSSTLDLSSITRQYLGYSNSLSFVRGYSFTSIDPEECTTVSATGNCGVEDRLIGSRLATASAEVRIPLFGSSEFGLINFPYLPTELSFFFDAGLAWNSGDNFFDLLTFDDGNATEQITVTDPATGDPRTLDVAKRMPVYSAGVSSRFNLFGYMVLEIYYAYPFQRPEKGAHFGFQLVPGW